MTDPPDIVPIRRRHNDFVSSHPCSTDTCDTRIVLDALDESKAVSLRMGQNWEEARFAAALALAQHNFIASDEAMREYAYEVLQADPTLICPDPAAHKGVTFTVDSLTAAVFAADDPNFRFATRGNCERFATAIIHAAKGDVSYPRHNEQERTSPDTPGG